MIPAWLAWAIVALASAVTVPLAQTCYLRHRRYRDGSAQAFRRDKPARYRKVRNRFYFQISSLVALVLIISWSTSQALT